MITILSFSLGSGSLRTRVPNSGCRAPSMAATHLSGASVPSELERRIQERLPGLPMTRRTRRELRQVVAETGVAIVKNDAAATVTRSALKTVTELVDEARKLAGDDPVKVALTLQLVQDYTETARRTNASVLGW